MASCDDQLPQVWAGRRPKERTAKKKEWHRPWVHNLSGGSPSSNLPFCYILSRLPSTSRPVRHCLQFARGRDEMLSMACSPRNPSTTEARSPVRVEPLRRRAVGGSPSSCAIGCSTVGETVNFVGACSLFTYVRAVHIGASRSSSLLNLLRSQAAGEKCTALGWPA